MLRDVFYYGKKPNVHPRERPAKTLDDAREQATTEHFWIINEYCDYKNFDWDFDFDLLPDEDVWAENHNNVWPSMYQKDSGTWLCSKEQSSIVIYRADVEPVKRKSAITENWIVDDEVDRSKFDFHWHPDPTDPPYIYRWGSKFFPVEIKHLVEYKTPGAVNIKYMSDHVELLVQHDRWVEKQEVDKSKFDFSWRPDPREPPFIYVWGNKFVGPELESTLEYHTPGATQIKYMEQPLEVVPQYDRWHEIQLIDKDNFDLSWRPDPREPPFIYVWGNKHISAQLKSTIEYHTPNAVTKKYMDDVVEVLPLFDNWVEYQPVDKESFDMTWRPDPREPPFIYVWGNKFVSGDLQPTIEFHVEGATERKYMGEPVAVLQQEERWNIVQKIDEKYYDSETIGFNLSWRPDPREPPYIYVWGNKYISAEVKPTIEYIVPGATKRKYMPDLIDVAPEWDKWAVRIAIDKEKNIKNGFDFSWRPDPREPPYVYTWGNKYIDGEIKPTLEYHVYNATSRKYMGNNVEILPDWDNWKLLYPIDRSSFDFSWRPDPKEPPYIWVFGNQHHDSRTMPTVEYHVSGATERKYMDHARVELLPNPNKFEHYDYCSNVDYTWVPNPHDEPYIYVWGNQWNRPEDRVSLKYIVPGATQIKYMENRVTRKPTMDNWIIPPNIDTTGFDFSWEPNPTEPPFIYEFGTQWQKTGGPKYVVQGATQTKYIDILKAKALPVKDKFKTIGKIKNFDYSWHPDSTEPPYIYSFGNQHQTVEKMISVQYVVPGATEVKFVRSIHATLDNDKTNWNILIPIDETKFDFSWVPDPYDPPYIYVFGNQWHDAWVEPTVEYTVLGGTERKYINHIRAKALPQPDKFKNNLQIEKFDYSWRPNPNDPPYIYVFGNQWHSAEVQSTIEFHVQGATDNKYITDVVATIAQDKSKWIIPEDIDDTNFDYSWVPNPNDPAYIYQFGTQWQKTGGPRYIVEGATEVNYIDNSKVIHKPKVRSENWQVPDNLDVSEFDFSWHPDNTEKPYIYQFGTQWQKTGGPKYVVKGATEVKYISTINARRNQVKDTCWKEILPIEQFDYSWHPDSTEEPYIYVFGTKYYDVETMPALRYEMENATDLKYVYEPKASLKPGSENWVIQPNLEISEFDFGWIPNPKDPPYIYIFGNQWNSAEIESTIEYHVPGATEKKYINDIVPKVEPNKKNFIIQQPIDESSFDFSWRPNPYDPPYIYEFGTQWQKTGGPKYVVEGATEIKYVDTIKAIALPNMANWYIDPDIDVSDFDFSWHPDNTDPDRIYKFGTLKNDNDGPTYITKPNLQITSENIVRLLRVIKKDNNHKNITPVKKYVVTTTLDELVKEHPNEVFWALNKNIDYSNFDFTWRPSIEQARYVHVFGSPDSSITHTYFISGPMYMQGYKDFNFLEKDIKVENEYLAKLFKKSDMFFIDKGNDESEIRYQALVKKYGNVQKTRYLNSWVDTIYRCIKKSTTPLCWILNSELDYENFNFDYYPNPWQMKMVHIFGTQWNHWGNTYLINCETFTEDTKYVKIIEHLQNINFVKNKRAKATNNLYDIYVVDHGNSQTNDVVEKVKLKSNGRNVTVVRYNQSYLQTIEDIIKTLPAKKDHYIWIIGSVCDYSNFDFSYITDPFARDNLHVFPSDKQKFGDTFLVDVNKTREVKEIQMLEEYPNLNFNQNQKVKRYNAPTFNYDDDTHTGHVNVDFDFPYAIFATEDIESEEETISLWNKESKTILITSTGATRIVVPKEAREYIKNEIYDYPYIKTASKTAKSKPLDIVFLSNGETQAEINYDHLLKVTKGYKNRIVRVSGVNGRVAAYHAALEASETYWAFTVFGKLRVSNDFDWNWQPDRLQAPKHYIFDAINPLNGLVYGHQGMIAYNKKLVLANQGNGLDFTLDDPHESVNVISGVANFNTDPYSTWRTAFREALKLQSAYDDLSKERLQTWLLKANGEYAKSCLLGAHDAVEYYKLVNGDIDKLKLSYEWDWLINYYNQKYKF